MKKNRTKDQEQKRKPRRLSLNRETIRFLNDPALLALVKGGGTEAPECPQDPNGTSMSDTYDPNACG
jgi:hypothetical protein